MAFNEEESKKLLMDLISRPSDAPTSTVGDTYKQIITFHNEMFPVAAVEAPKKKKRRRGAGSTLTGWPSGVTRQEYGAWKAAKQAKGITENLNPHFYKADRDGTPAPITKPAAAKKEAAPPAAAAPKKETASAEKKAEAKPAPKPAEAVAAK